MDSGLHCLLLQYNVLYQIIMKQETAKEYVEPLHLIFVRMLPRRPTFFYLPRENSDG